MLLAIFIMILALTALTLLLFGVMRWIMKRLAKPAPHRTCKCGYLLVGLPVPRCPECGRAVGFDKTFEELGLTAEELRRMK